ncbi:hypothetical protein [uncultured Thiodictyon sp.]|uniref:hypothetical protein n=1 Tax=uncultured Thiodictyon sp. TaxID=1846217 RepID=UPI0025FE0D77|nr:hypothetical protein [uncultured Thiodictyon sp.]
MSENRSFSIFFSKRFLLLLLFASSLTGDQLYAAGDGSDSSTELKAPPGVQAAGASAQDCQSLKGIKKSTCLLHQENARLDDEGKRLDDEGKRLKEERKRGEQKLARLQAEEVRLKREIKEKMDALSEMVRRYYRQETNLAPH